jgi:CubicO group peptidase (beta-lactamase class C family)
MDSGERPNHDRIQSLLLGAVLISIFAPACRFVSAQAPPVKSIEELFVSLNSKQAPGAAVLVLKDGQKIFQRGYGVADLRDLRAIDERTNFRLASVTKQFTAMAVMLLVHDGKLRYDTRLTDIFPGFPEYGRSISIRRLLNHTSGLLDYEERMPKLEAGRQIQDAEVLDLLMRQTATKFPPGDRWDYSNSGYVLLGEAVARVSGKPFGEFLRDRIFRPLGMNGSVAFQNGRNQVANRAFGHSRAGGTWRQTDQSPTSATLGDGGVYSSLADMARWDRALSTHALLSEKEMSAAFTPVKLPSGSAVEPDGSPAEYGFGWFLNSYRGRSRMWHYGETVGFRTAIQRFPADRLTIVILCNRADLNPTSLALKVADLCLGK